MIDKPTGSGSAALIVFSGIILLLLLFLSPIASSATIAAAGLAFLFRKECGDKKAHRGTAHAMAIGAPAMVALFTDPLVAFVTLVMMVTLLMAVTERQQGPSVKEGQNV